jgi:NAD(P)-dependent dehydrogenase (short-subunit alcohol dehydrogenase family)
MAPPIPSRILIFGATGTIGEFITRAIISASPSFEHIAIFTSKQTIQAKASLFEEWKAASPGMAVIAGDVSSEDDIAAAYTQERPDTVVSCLGRGALMVQTQLIQIASAHGVKWFFPSEYGTDVEYGPQSPREKPHQNKLAVRRFIRENVTEMQVTYLVTGPYFDMWMGLSPNAVACGGFDPTQRKAVLLGDGEGKIGFCTMLE